MSPYDGLKRTICSMLKANNYRFREGAMPGDDFRIFVVPSGLEEESEEIFKVKGVNTVCCGAVILL